MSKWCVRWYFNWIPIWPVSYLCAKALSKLKSLYSMFNRTKCWHTVYMFVVSHSFYNSVLFILAKCERKCLKSAFADTVFIQAIPPLLPEKKIN